MTMTLDDVLEQSGVMLGAGKLPTADQLVMWREAIALHLAGIGEPVGYACPKTMQGYTLGEWADFACGDKSEARSVPLYAAPPIDLAAVREVIAEMRHMSLTDGYLNDAADKLEAAIATQTKEPMS